MLVDPAALSFVTVTGAAFRGFGCAVEVVEDDGAAVEELSEAESVGKSIKYQSADEGEERTYSAQASRPREANPKPPYLSAMIHSLCRPSLGMPS